MQDLNASGYTAAQVQDRLVQPAVQERWIFDRLDAVGGYLSDLTPYVDERAVPEVAFDTTAAVKRTLRLLLMGNAAFNPLKEMIRPHYQLRMADGGWADWSLGTFVLASMEKEIGLRGSLRTISAVDVSQLLVDSGFLNSHAVAAGTPYGIALGQIVAGCNLLNAFQIQALIPDPGKALPAALNWAAGDSRLRAVNDLLTAVDFRTAWMDEQFLRSSPNQDFQPAAPPPASFTFDTVSSNTGRALVHFPFIEVTDPQAANNQVLVLGEDPRIATPVSAFYENISDTSPVSRPNWHAKLWVERDSSIADSGAAAARAATIARSSSRDYLRLRINTVPWAFSQDHDLYELIFSTADEGLSRELYIETGWRHYCKAGSATQHEWQRLVAA